MRVTNEDVREKITSSNIPVFLSTWAHAHHRTLTLAHCLHPITDQIDVYVTDAERCCQQYKMFAVEGTTAYQQSQ